MFIISRQTGEAIMIGDNIEISVVDIRGDKVRLAVRTPKGVNVHRKEVYDVVRREGLAEAQVKPPEFLQPPKDRQ